MPLKLRGKMESMLGSRMYDKHFHLVKWLIASNRRLDIILRNCKPCDRTYQ
jgi:hypothetical protein